MGSQLQLSTEGHPTPNENDQAGAGGIGAGVGDGEGPGSAPGAVPVEGSSEVSAADPQEPLLDHYGGGADHGVPSPVHGPDWA